MNESIEKTVAILQPGYLPWLGFFEQLSNCDIYVLLDDVQYTKNDWRNRNRIKTKDGIQWLTVPIHYQYGQKIIDAKIDQKGQWSKKHIGSLRSGYGRSKYFGHYIESLQNIFLKDWKFLVDLDIELILWLKKILGIHCEVVRSSDFKLPSIDRQMKLVEICKYFGCKRFYEGQSGKNYMDLDLFSDHGILVEFQDYQHPFYNQLWLKEQGFISHLSIIDLLFNYGPESNEILCGKKKIPRDLKIKVRSADELKN